VRPLAVAAAYGVVLVRPGGDEPIDVETLIDAATARGLDDLGLEHVECVNAAREMVARDLQMVVDELGAQPGTVAVAGHAIVEPVADGVEVTRVFALAHGEGCVVDRRRYRVRA
jgi:hypothetical protein